MEISENQISGKGLLTGRDPSFSTEIYPRTAPNSCKKNNMENLLKIYEIRKKNKKSPNMGNLHATRIFRKFCNFFYRVTSSFCHTVWRRLGSRHGNKRGKQKEKEKKNKKNQKRKRSERREEKRGEEKKKVEESGREEKRKF